MKAGGRAEAVCETIAAGRDTFTKLPAAATRSDCLGRQAVLGFQVSFY